MTFAVTAGTVPLAYRWVYNSTNFLLNATNTSLSLTNLQLTNAGNYTVIITNTAGAVTSSVAQLTVWQPPVITNQPVSVTNVAGSSPVFSVVSGGFPAPVYQWRLNTNTTVSGATSPSLTLTYARSSQAGTYNVIITNSAGSVTSSVARLVITNPPPTSFSPGSASLTGNNFTFKFTPVAGLTNAVLTNSQLTGGTWNVYTNIPPTATPTPVTITNPVNGTGNVFYQIQVAP